MAWTAHSIILVAALLLGACAVPPPTGPSVGALAPKDKDPAQFQQDDLSCRQLAFDQLGGIGPTDAANESLLNSSALGTVLGAAAGAAIGAAAGNAGAGAAIGAGSGLLLGAASGSNAAQYSAMSQQQRYDLGYSQCMTARGNIAPVVAPGAAPYGYPYYPVYGYPYAYPYYYPYAYPYPYPYPYAYPYPWGAVGIGTSFVFVNGHGHGHGHTHSGGPHH